jgi:hypothetical protein
MSKVIRIGDVSIPLENYATSGNAILGIKESGKTVLSKGIAEQLIEYDVMPIIFDAIGVWRHLKTAGDGPNAKGFKVVVAGGKEPDLPLTPASAAEIVRAALRENIPLVIDLYDKKLSKADWRRIVQSCFTTMLYENEIVRHIFLEEAPEYVPQKVMDGETFAAVEKLVRMGGNASLGITLISQRAQEVNKSVLENVILMRQRGTHAIDSLEKFMDRMAPEQSRAITKKMPNMTAGEAYIFTGTSDQAEYTRSQMCRSFHPNRRKPVAIDASKRTVITSDFVTRLSADLTKVVEEAKANDPKALRARIAQLEREMKGQTFVTSEDPDKAYERGRAVGYESGWRDGATHEREAMVAPLAAVNNATAAICDAAGNLDVAVNEAHRQNDPRMATPPPPANGARAENPIRSGTQTVRSAPSPARPAPRARQIDARAPLPTLSGGAMRVLEVLSQFPEGCTANKLALLAGRQIGGGFRNTLSELRVASALEGENTGIMRITDAGLSYGPFEPLPSGDEVRRYWLNNPRLSGGARNVLEVLLTNPRGFTADVLADRANREPGGGFRNTLSELRVAGLLVGKNNGVMTASEDLLS